MLCKQCKDDQAFWTKRPPKQLLGEAWDRIRKKLGGSNDGPDVTDAELLDTYVYQLRLELQRVRRELRKCQRSHQKKIAVRKEDIDNRALLKLQKFFYEWKEERNKDERV